MGFHLGRGFFLKFPKNTQEDEDVSIYCSDYNSEMVESYEYDMITTKVDKNKHKPTINSEVTLVRGVENCLITFRNDTSN